MGLVGDPQRTRPIQMGWEVTIKLYLNWRFGFIDNPDRQFGNGLVCTRIRTWCDGPVLLLTLFTVEREQSWFWAWAVLCGCKLTILSANLSNLLSLNTITRRFLTRQELQKRCMRNVPYYYEYNQKLTLSNPKPHDVCYNQCLR